MALSSVESDQSLLCPHRLYRVVPMHSCCKFRMWSWKDLGFAA